jgi:hypothetical protein
VAYSDKEIVEEYLRTVIPIDQVTASRAYIDATLSEKFIDILEENK